MGQLILHSANVVQTEQIGAALAKDIRQLYGSSPCFVALTGDLGAGKTVFVRGFCSVLSPGSRVKSPTYTIVNEYRCGAYPVFHFDLYRMEDSDSLDSIGFDEYLESGICIAEWSEHLGDRRPDGAIGIRIEKKGEEARDIVLDLPAIGKEFTHVNLIR